MVAALDLEMNEQGNLFYNGGHMVRDTNLISVLEIMCKLKTVLSIFKNLNLCLLTHFDSQDCQYEFRLLEPNAYMLSVL